jgi:hypothetical protein
MRRFKEFQSAIFDKGDATASELNLKLIAVVARAEQHRLSFQVNSCLPMLQDTLDDCSATRMIHSARSRASMNCTGSFPSPGARISLPRASRKPSWVAS